jgi:hypothetical protein
MTGFLDSFRSLCKDKFQRKCSSTVGTNHRSSFIKKAENVNNKKSVDSLSIEI